VDNCVADRMEGAAYPGALCDIVQLRGTSRKGASEGPISLEYVG
jgi:hypothetical protein